MGAEHLNRLTGNLAETRKTHEKYNNTEIFLEPEDVWPELGGKLGGEVALYQIRTVLAVELRSAVIKAEPPTSSVKDIVDSVTLEAAQDLQTVFGRAAAILFFERKRDTFGPIIGDKKRPSRDAGELTRRMIACNAAIAVIQDLWKPEKKLYRPIDNLDQRQLANMRDKEFATTYKPH